MALSDHRLIRLLEKLALPASDYVVTGSGPLLAHGLKKNIHDIDLVARGKAWDLAALLGTVRPSKAGLGYRILLADGEIEVFDHWVGGLLDTDRMIDSAELIEGLPFLPLRETLLWKRGLGRAKDLRDIALIERHLALAAR